MGSCCTKCTKAGGWIMLIVGLAFLLVDLGKFSFFGIKWWTALFIIMGVMKLGMSSCKDCQVMTKKK